MSVWIIQHVLADEHAGFDRFPKSDFIGQEIPLSWIAKNSAYDTELMNFQVDDRRQQAPHSGAGCPL